MRGLTLDGEEREDRTQRISQDTVSCERGGAVQGTVHVNNV